MDGSTKLVNSSPQQPGGSFFHYPKLPSYFKQQFPKHYRHKRGQQEPYTPMAQRDYSNYDAQKPRSIMRRAVDYSSAVVRQLEVSCIVYQPSSYNILLPDLWSIFSYKCQIGYHCNVPSIVIMSVSVIPFQVNQVSHCLSQVFSSSVMFVLHLNFFQVAHCLLQEFSCCLALEFLSSSTRLKEISLVKRNIFKCHIFWCWYSIQVFIACH